MHDAYSKRDISHKVESLKKQLKELEKNKNLALEQYVEPKKAVEEAGKKWSQNEYDLGEALREAESLKVGLKKMEAYTY